MYNKQLQIVIVLFFLASLHAFGEKPKKGDTGASYPPSQGEFMKSRDIAVEPTAQKQFDKALKEYNQALRVNFSNYNQRAIQSFESYLKYYPQAEKRLEAIFYLEKLYLKELDYKNHEKYLNQFEQEAPTSNTYYSLSQLDRAAYYVRKNQNSAAEKLLNELLAANSQDKFLKREIFKNQIPIYKAENENKKLIVIYEYLISDKNNEEFKSNINNYYYYLFNLGELYYKEANYAKAKKAFEEVIAAKDFETTYMKEISEKYLNKLKAIKPAN